MSCWLAQFSDARCDGYLVRAHLISKQRIRREVISPKGVHLTGEQRRAILFDPRVWVPACGGISGLGGHHGALDGRILSVPRSALPEGLEAFAAEYGLTWSLDRDFGLREAAA
jgi:hypothetical protein